MVDASMKGISKEQSKQLQGLAVLLMVYHHFFNDLSIFGESLQFGKPQWVITFAWFGKICVGIFAFVSGYGMERILEREKQPAYVSCLRQVLRLLIRYWFVLLLFMGLFFGLGRRTFEPREFLENFFCLKLTYNGAFWYVQEYLIFMALLALFDGWLGAVRRLMRRWIVAKEGGQRPLTKREKGQVIVYGFVSVAGAAFLLSAPVSSAVRDGWKGFFELIRIAFVLVFFMGWFMAKVRIFERVFLKLASWKVGMKKVFGIVVILAVFAMRAVLADSPAYARLDFLLVPVFVLGVLLCLEGSGLLQGMLFRTGKISAYLWLTHLFVFDLTKDTILLFTHSHLLFFAAELIACILVSHGFLAMEAGCGRVLKMIKAGRKGT